MPTGVQCSAFCPAISSKLVLRLTSWGNMQSSCCVPLHRCRLIKRKWAEKKKTQGNRLKPWQQTWFTVVPSSNVVSCWQQWLEKVWKKGSGRILFVVCVFVEKLMSLVKQALESWDTFANIGAVSVAASEVKQLSEVSSVSLLFLQLIYVTQVTSIFSIFFRK